MWKKEYWDNDGELYRDLSRENDDVFIAELGRYEIIFEYDNQRYYCFIDAVNMEEALGIFFKNHSSVTYDNIIEHIEI